MLGFAEPHLTTEQARRNSAKRWAANRVLREQALEHAQQLGVPTRAAAARELVKFAEARGQSLTVETTDAWLKSAGWKPKG